MELLKDKLASITGSSRGLGAAIAAGMAAHGARVMAGIVGRAAFDDPAVVAIGETSEVVDAVIFQASPMARSITGTLPVDGGFLAA
jgi:NAD(P)-dependent dehydrogenase (short-subunit alcohol dehydrogenase family)